MLADYHILKHADQDAAPGYHILGLLPSGRWFDIDHTVFGRPLRTRAEARAWIDNDCRAWLKNCGFTAELDF